MTDFRQPLSAALLRKACDPADFDFATTEELADIGVVVGQERALDAIRVGLGITQEGFNVFALGPTGLGKTSTIKEIVEREAEGRPVPDDWCYVYHFAEPAKPATLRLPAGHGQRFVRDMDQLIEELGTAIPAAFDGEEFRGRAEEIEEETKERETNAIGSLRREAQQQQIALIETPTGFAFAPLDDKNEVYSPDEFHKLAEQEQRRIEEAIEQFHQRLQKLLRQFPVWRREAKKKIKALNREIAAYVVSHPIDELKTEYAAAPDVLRYLETVRQEIVEHTDDFLPKSGEAMAALFGQGPRTSPLQRYRVNLLVDNGRTTKAPIVFESLPSHGNLIGRVEYQALMGALVTDFTMIKPGALHRANGGYLILDARKLLLQPFAWETLKRTLEAGEIRIEALERSLGFMSTATLEPAPIPLQVKIVLTGDRILYYLLGAYDPEFREMFKISADFEETLDRDSGGIALYARLVASLARRNRLKALEKDAVILVVEQAARMAEDAEKLSTHLRSLDDLLKEADYWAEQAGRKLIAGSDIQKAIDQRIRRADRIRERIYEAIRRGTILIDTDGATVGQVNGLSVLSLGDFAFGQPSRITATTRLGAGKIVDIERESELGGAIHSKGVMILSAFIAARYARGQPLSLAASLVFEQSYGMVDGDSASLAELCAILSSLAEIPIRQSFAVTGSVNQHGKVQPIGGVNEKIEGFFDVCAAGELKGRQAVIIPASNVKHLMLRKDVVEAVGQGRFHVYAVDTVDQALELLMQIPAGERDTDGQFPMDSVNGKVETRLQEWAELRQQLSQAESNRNNQHDD